MSDNISPFKDLIGIGKGQGILKVKHNERTYLIRTACIANLRHALTSTSDYTRVSKMIES